MFLLNFILGSLQAMETLSDTEVVANAMASLQCIFGAVPSPTHTYVTRWQEDEFSR